MCTPAKWTHTPHYTTHTHTHARAHTHTHAPQSFGLEDLAVLILDEADRLLEMGFKEEVSVAYVYEYI